ncbi:MAG: hypothetical protein K9J37_08735 [Saprospiraceae bacterium]|nr:hypothetical protein [Saprospiraceae bacterium]MCF8249986.1 hypothetical protein [Saprospiraceae bacterium]MCF8278974.1 hypothetical protein [Bacteroidales bacterium]MCF8310999.1 hypothetical protein [Saprospiraceae bacterium]MCF8439665.1 hypothetical protein [Saprospiraceae bacterium]
MPSGDVIQSKYPVLFQVKVLHHYFLDKSKTLFDNLSALDKIRILAEYDVRNLLKIAPTPSTQRILEGHNLLFKPHGQGFAVLCQADGNGVVGKGKKPEVGEKLRFWVKIVDPYFMQYSAGFLKNELVRIEKSTDGRSPDRFFKQVYHLKNDGLGQSNSLAATPASYEPSSEYAPESIVQHDADLDTNMEFYIAQRAIATNTPPTTVANLDWLKLEQIAPQNSNIRYVSQADLTELELADDIPQDTFALIEIEATAGAGAMHLYDGTDKLNAPTFEVRFKNRLTWWRHSLPTWVEGALTSITQPEIRPLTLRGKQKIDLIFQVSDGNNGNVPLEKKGVDVPSKQTPVLPETTNNGSVTRLLSDIYI